MFWNRIGKIIAWAVSGFFGGFVVTLANTPIESMDWTLALMVACGGGAIKLLTEAIEFIEDWKKVKKSKRISAYFP